MTITADDALKALTAAVREYGDDWVDPHSDPDAYEPSCVNVYEDPDDPTITRHCIAAKALSILGVDNGTLLAFNESSIFDATRAGVELSNGALLILARAQSTQDNGLTWREAHLSAALRSLDID